MVPMSNKKQGLLKNLFGEKKPKTPRTVKWSTSVSTKNEGAILKFYDELVPEAQDIPVDIDMLVNEAFPVFERCLGEINWNKITKYFGIGIKSPAKNIRHDEVSILISELRTIENAQYYLVGFSDLLEKYASKVANAPEGTTTVEKAKVARMFFTLYSYFYFFSEDYMVPLGSKQPVVNYLKAAEVNKKSIYPEEMFYLYKASVERYGEESILYDAIIEDIRKFDKRIRKDILDFAELKMEEERLISVNKKSTFSTFGNVRKLKTKMFQGVGYFPNELYFVKDMWKTLEFGELYSMYKLITQNEFNSFPTRVRKMPTVEGSTFLEKDFEFRIIAPGVEMSCLEEAQRFVRFIEYLAKRNVTMPIEVVSDEDENKLTIENVEIGKFFAFVTFARKSDYLAETSNPSDEYSMYYSLINYKGGDEVITAYMNGEILEQDVKEKLGIDQKFETEIFGIEHAETMLETVKRFAVENNIVVNEEDVSVELIENVLIPGNEKIWQAFAKGEMSSKEVFEKIGIDINFIEMYFCTYKIDVEALEEKLQELKTRRASKKEMQKNALTINLYCYVIEGQIACGPKNRVPKGNKRLKPENLRNLIA